MTDKRFELAYETNDQNTIWWAVRDGEITLWKEEVVGLLNELHEENEERKRAMRLAEYYNEQLVNQNKKMKKYIDSISKGGLE